MKRDHWPVEDFGIRPAGKPDECFYCQEPKGWLHRPDCVMRQRTVVVALKVELVLTEPESWTRDEIEFFLDESSSCQSNLVDRMNELRDRLGCLCGKIEAVYVREATAEDEEQQKLFVRNVPT